MKRNAFTLVEVLVVIVILAILAAILYPVISKARVRGDEAVAISNCGQQLKAQTLYMIDYDDRYPMLDIAPKANMGGLPLKYFWPQLITPYINPGAKPHGWKGIMTIDDLPKIFFDPIKPFKSQYTENLHFGRFTSWGYSNEISRQRSCRFYRYLGDPLYSTSVSSPSSTIDLAETDDWVSQGGFPGDCEANTFFDIPNITVSLPPGDFVRESTDAPYPSGKPRMVPDNPLDMNGLNIVGYCDGHVRATPVTLLIHSGKLWSTRQDGKSDRPQ